MKFNLKYSLGDNHFFEEVHYGNIYLDGMMEIGERLEELDNQGLYPLKDIVITVEKA